MLTIGFYGMNGCKYLKGSLVTLRCAKATGDYHGQLLRFGLIYADCHRTVKLMKPNPYQKATFLKSAAKVSQLPEDTGIEVAFAGRSNAGKSSALNCLCGIRQLARTSKTPGRTQLINLFTLEDENHRLVDLPGYGYAKVALQVKHDWQKNLAHYLDVRDSLKGLVVLMDIRHPLKELDTMMIDWACNRDLPVHILLTKADKVSRGQAQSTVLLVRKQYELLKDLISIQPFSSLKKQGVDELIAVLNGWFRRS